jgi:hypothetical protein
VKNTFVALAAIALAGAGATSAHAQASTVDLVQNGYFDQLTNGSAAGGYYTGSGTAPAGSQEAVDWTACVLNDCSGVAGYPFLFIATPGVADGTHTNATNGFADPWDDPAGAGNSSQGIAYRSLWGAGNGGVGQNGSNGSQNSNAFNGYGPNGDTTDNFLIADGAYHTASIGQLITGLHVGDHYSLTFDWAAGQWDGNTGNTTERFQIGFGNSTASTPTFLLNSKSFSGWMQDTITFTATSTSEELSFLAVGTPTGEPPMLLLDDVAMYDTPEPGAFALLVVGMGALGVAARRRRAK